MRNILFAFLLVPTIVNAGPIGGTFSNQSPTTYFNNPSWDGPGLNLSELHPTLPYLNDGSENPTPIIYDTTNVTGYSLIGEISAYQDLNFFYWSDGVNFGGIFDPTDSPITSRFPSSTQTIWFYISGPGGIYNSKDNPEHFALLKESDNSFILGGEDLPFNFSDNDLNDIRVRITEQTTVPEPSSLFLLGSGLVLLARRFRNG